MGRGLLVPVTLSALVACAPPISLSFARPGPDNGSLFRSDANHRAPGGAPLPTEQSRVDVRYYRYAPSVTVIAWSDDEAAFGLRGTVRRDGSLVRDHRLYVSTYFEPGVRAYTRAAIGPRKLQMAGVSRDRRPCWNYPACSPPESYAARIPDRLLRESRDSVAVMFYSLDGRHMVITVYRDVIDKYLATVDSVSAELQRK